MKILFISPHQVWPQNTGAKLRNFHLASALASRCTVTLFQLLPPAEARREDETAGRFEEIVAIRKDPSYTPSKLFRGVLGPLPVSVLNYSCHSAAERLTELVNAEPFDTIHLVSIHLIDYLKTVRAAPNHPPVLMDWHNIESELMLRYAERTSSWPRRMIARRTAHLLQATELHALETCDAVTVVSDREKHELLARRPKANIHVIPNGVDVASYSAKRRVASSCMEPLKRQTLLFVGSMNYHANIDAVTWFVQEAWPELSRTHPALHFVIAGSDPSPAVRALASPRVHITGTVDDVQPFYHAAAAVVVPLRVGGGTRLKILEAMAAGVPVISTSIGAEGLPLQHGTNVLFADSPQEMISAVGQLLQNPEDGARLAAQAATLVRHSYDWDAIGSQLYSLHARLAGQFSRLLDKRSVLLRN